MNKTYTLVLDLDETLIHYQESDDESGYVNIRPHTALFLQEMSQHFNLVVFTAAQESYARQVLQFIDPEDRFFSKKFFRQHLSYDQKGFPHKNLLTVQQDLSKVFLIDNMVDNFQNQKENGILIDTWHDDPTDICLLILRNYLLQLVKDQPSDVREYFHSVKRQITSQVLEGNLAHFPKQ